MTEMALITNSPTASLRSDMVLLVGIADHPEGGIKAYIEARYLNRYAWVPDPDVAADIRTLWFSGGHGYIPRPAPDEIFVEQP